MADDAEKLRKQIDVLSNLIKSHKEIKQKDSSTKGQEAGRYSWTKSRNPKDKEGIPVAISSEPKLPKQKTSFPILNAKHGQTNRDSTHERCQKQRGSSSLVKMEEKALPNDSQRFINRNKNFESDKDKLLQHNEVELKSRKSLNEQSHSDSEIYKEKKYLIASRTEGVSNASLGQSKAISSSMSSLVARISELSSTLASASAKLKPQRTKPVGKSRPQVKSENAGLLKLEKQSSMAKNIQGIGGTAQTSSKSSDRSFSKFNKQNKYTVNRKVKKEPQKASVDQLKWTKQGMSSTGSQISGSLPLGFKGKRPARDHSVPSTSKGKMNVWTRAKGTPVASRFKVWKRPQGEFKLTRAKTVAPNRVVSIPSQHGTLNSRRKRAGSIQRKSIISRYSVVHTKRKLPIHAQKSSKVVVIEGVAYKTSTNKLLRTKAVSKPPDKGKMRRSSVSLNIRGEKFIMDRSGKTLRRITKESSSLQAEHKSGTSKAFASTPNLAKRQDISGDQPLVARQQSLVRRISIGGAVFTETEPGVLVRTSQTSRKLSASRKSVHNALMYKYQKQAQVKSKTEQYCMYYNRFGKCNNGDKCPYVHDPSKVAVCTRFLRGTCKKTDGSCLFSHKLDKEKMPVCQFFLKGTCFNDDCPYSHVNVSSKAAVCEDFLKGYCPRGRQCTKKHSLECEEFSRTGKCSKGRKCKQLHRAKRKTKKRQAGGETDDAPAAKKPAMVMTEEEGFLPLVKESTTDETTSNTQEINPSDEQPDIISTDPRIIGNE